MNRPRHVMIALVAILAISAFPGVAAEPIVSGELLLGGADD